MTFAYNHVAALQFLRTTHKAGPLVALAIALLGGMAAAEGARRLAGRRTALAGLAALAGALLVVLSVWPLARGRAVEGRPSSVPAAWQAAQRHVDARGGRAVVLPASCTRTTTGAAPSTRCCRRSPARRSRRGRRPVRRPAGDDLLWTTDALVQQRRALPGQVPSLLD